MKSLHFQFTLRLLVGGTLLLGLASGALQWRLRAVLTNHFDVALQASVRAATAFTEQIGGQVLLEPADETMSWSNKIDNADVLLLRESTGREVMRSESLEGLVVPLTSGPAEAPEFWDAMLVDGRAMRFVGIRYAPTPTDEEPVNLTPGLEAILVIGRDRLPLDQSLRSLRNTMLLFGGLTLAALVALVRWSVRDGLAPLDRLGEAVAGVDAKNLTTRFSDESLPDELRPIAVCLNGLLERLESSFERERRFTANVAHELRTPIAELRTLAEVNLTTPSNEEERRESWHDALNTALRMESLAVRLLELARTDDAAVVVHSEVVSLAATLLDAWRPWTDHARGRRVEAEFDLPGGLTLATDPVLLSGILGNLCGNAAEYAAEGTTFRVSATLQSEAVVIHFRNCTDGLSSEEVSHLFERFWKRDASRADGRRHGLGLALAAEYAALLRGSLTAHLVADGELEFVLTLPTEAMIFS